MSDCTSQMVCDVVEGLPCGICFVSMDDEERLVYGNRAFLSLTGFSSVEELLSWCGGSFEKLMAKRYIPLRQRYEAGKDGKVSAFHFLLETKAGPVPAEGLVGMEETAAFGKVWCVICICRQDDSKVDEAEQLMSRESFYPVIYRLAREDVENHCFGRRVPLYFNLTNFKIYNSRHGMEAGDGVIRYMAERLRAHFPHAQIAHLTGDTFAVLAPHQDVTGRIEAVAREMDGYVNDSSVRLKAGVHLIDPENVEVTESSLHLLFDRAKIAADWIKGDAGRTWALYEESMGRRLADRAYVLGHFEEALEKGYIQVYYQTIVRTLTGKVCAVEALARWQDPVKGLIMPSLFVPVLEESKLIHRLDAFVIEEVARKYLYIKEMGRPVAPVSVNLSAVDFEVMEPFDFVESMVRKYRVPRSLYHIEVTESALKKNEEKLKKELRRFRKTGYHCWLDDFGSGYSTLNVLKSYPFDTLKLDMMFMRNLNEQGLEIIRSIILIAKRLSLHTLAEGVETEEQARFLRDIGCEMIQGWYYAKPLPYEESYQDMLARGLSVEEPWEAELYEKAGLVNVITDTPSGIFLADRDNISIILRNEASRQVSEEIHVKYKEGSAALDLAAPVKKQMQDLIRLSWKTHRKESMNYIYQGSHAYCAATTLAFENGVYGGRYEYYAISPKGEDSEAAYMDKLLRHLFIVYDGLYVIQRRTGQVQVMESMNRLAKTGDTIPVSRFLKLSRFLHEGDRERFYLFMDMAYLEKEARKLGRSAVTGLFRLRMENGSYRWKEFNFALMESDEGDDVLLGIKDTAAGSAAEGEDILPLYASSLGLLSGKGSGENEKIPVFQALLDTSEACFFWKDRDRRFLGASHAFLKTYGLALEDILGKTDEDMGWHVDNSRYRDEEERVLRQGVVSRNVPGECIIHGRIHHIRATKFPVYEGNEIAGLAGYFMDVDRDGKLLLENRESDMKDPETGLLNYRGLLMNALAYQANYEAHGENYVLLAMHVPELVQIGKIYGSQVKGKLLNRVTRLISDFFFHREILAHLGGGRFFLIMKAESTSAIRHRMMELSGQIHEIHEESGKSVTLFLQYSLAMASEAKGVDSLFHLALERQREAEKSRYGQSLYRSDRILFDRVAFDTCECQVMIADRENYRLLYVNEAGLRDLGLPENYPYWEKTCYELLCARPVPCDMCPQGRLRHDRFYTRSFRNTHTGSDYLINHTLVNWNGKECHFEMAVNLGLYAEKDMKDKHLLFQEVEVNDAMAAALAAPTPDEGIMQLLTKAGEFLEAEKVCVFEEQLDGTVKNTYEWCAPGIMPAKDRYQKVSMDMARPLYDRFGPDQIAIIDDVEKVSRTYGFSAAAFRPGLKTVISGHLVSGGKSLGYTEVVNPSERTRKEASPLLATLTRFLTSLLRSRDTICRLDHMSHRDQLTGLMNRWSFMEYVHHLKPGQKAAFLFGDMNGLKKVNDSQGHEAGDRALIALGRAMEQVTGPGRAFRMGGDEFIMVLEDEKVDRAEEIMKELKETLRRQGLGLALGCARRTAPVIDIDGLISEMDEKMYEDKKIRRR